MSFGTPAAEEAPVCPRHPDRVSYVRCQRCGRPACPECQRPAAVGVQCVDCVREARAAAPRARGVFGGRAARGRPVVTWSIIGLCVAVYVLQLAIPGDYVFQNFAFANMAAVDEPWRMLTSAFLHSQSNILHLGLNMYTLWIFGQMLEPLLGRARFLALYLISAVGGSVGYMLLTPVTSNVGVIGASGAIFGLFGAALLIQRRMGGAMTQLWVLLAINLAFGFMVPGIAWQAHLGGLATGAACAGILVGSGHTRRPAVLQWAGLAVVVIALALLTVWRDASTVI
ncbi:MULTISPECIES: rhomboid family intramembrane serine protease [Arthrobacter]|uniref:Rhomboid family intramembrane serine protease n=2 Tax=Arthrobacter TaxID=1663 RepID=A0ABU9KIW9_9MICC|nr:rhomboid family intramembrane serine protease [Arthrobacter sp. YJM1]MDP5226921.1 rhomboid family intramembrane serine protease [Arthrobacter sp. YJM1]